MELVTRLYDRFGFDTVDNSPLSESWRSGPVNPRGPRTSTRPVPN
ncbi:hypothetical protein ACWGPD_34635 [Streptomyces hirsutus]